MLLLFVFTLKAGVFPLWFWLPDTYPTCPIAIAALFGGVLTKVGAYAIARIFPLIFFHGNGAEVLVPLLTLGAALTMGVGIFGVLAYGNLRRILAMFIVVGVGYALFGIALNTEHALAGSAFYMAQSMIVMAACFLACGIIESHAGTDRLARMGGLLKTNPWLGVLFFVALLSVAGLPPTAGFYGKFAIIQDGLSEGFTKTALIAILAGGLSLLAIARIWGTSFWGPDARPETPSAPAAPPRPASASAYAALALLTAAALFIGFVPQPAASLATTAGHQATPSRPLPHRRPRGGIRQRNRPGRAHPARRSTRRKSVPRPRDRRPGRARNTL